MINKGELTRVFLKRQEFKAQKTLSELRLDIENGPFS